MLAEFLSASSRGVNFMYPSAVDSFRRQFAHLESGGTGQATGGNLGQATSLPRERIRDFQHEAQRYMTGPASASTSQQVRSVRDLLGFAWHERSCVLTASLNRRQLRFCLRILFEAFLRLSFP